MKLKWLQASDLKCKTEVECDSAVSAQTQKAAQSRAVNVHGNSWLSTENKILCYRYTYIRL